jgi:hypothetical protein
MKKNDYTQGLEKQLEELQEKLAISEYEAEQYKALAKDRKGKLVLIDNTGQYSRDIKAMYMVDIAVEREQQPSGHFLYKVVKDRAANSVGKLYTLEKLREFVTG